VEDKRRWVLDGQYTGQTALSLVGQVWGRDLSNWNPDGPLPADDPVPAPISVTRGAARDGKDPIAIARSGGRSPRRRTSHCARSSSKRRRVRGSWGRRARSPTSSPAGYAQARPTLQHLAVHRARRTRRDRRLAGARTPGTRCLPGPSTRRRRCAVTSGFVKPLTRRQNTETDGSAAG